MLLRITWFFPTTAGTEIFETIKSGHNVPNATEVGSIIGVANIFSSRSAVNNAIFVGGYKFKELVCVPSTVTNEMFAKVISKMIKGCSCTPDPVVPHRVDGRQSLKFIRTVLK